MFYKGMKDRENIKDDPVTAEHHQFTCETDHPGIVYFTLLDIHKHQTGSTFEKEAVRYEQPPLPL